MISNTLLFFTDAPKSTAKTMGSNDGSEVEVGPGEGTSTAVFSLELELEQVVIVARVKKLDQL